MARRAPSGDTPRATTITVRLTEPERALVEQRAASAGMTVSRYAAEQIMRGRVMVEQRQSLAPELRSELSRIGNNVNQIARALNDGHHHPGLRNIATALQEVFEFIMRDELLRRRAEEAKGNGSQDGQARGVVSGSGPLPVPR